jgi:predicted ATPase
MTCCRRLHRVVLAGYDEAGGGKGHMRLSKYGLEPVTVKETDHYRITREFCDDQVRFVEAAIRGVMGAGKSASGA